MASCGVPRMMTSRPNKPRQIEAAGDSTETLRYPIEKRVAPFHMPAANQTKRHRRI